MIITCAACGNQKTDHVLLVMPDLTVRKVCMVCINKLWRKVNPEYRKQSKNAKTHSSASSD